MKFLKHTSFILFFFALTSSIFAQDNKETVTKDLVLSKHFVFKADMALPSTGQAVQLTSPYDVRVNNDKVVAYLPYYGRAYNIEYGATDGGIKFTSTKFDYKIKDRKKGGWEITILPKDNHDVREIFMTVSTSGYATMQVISNERQPITFNGFVSAK